MYLGYLLGTRSRWLGNAKVGCADYDCIVLLADGKEEVSTNI